MQLREVLVTENIEERNRALRYSFASLAPWLETKGDEEQALVILLNLSHKRVTVADLCDEQLAKSTLQDSTHVERCVRTVRWMHSHNLKYPDTRVSRQRLLVLPPPLIKGIVTSAGLSQHLGWANNSADINYSKLFTATFLYEGRVTNLALLLSDKHPVWMAALSKLGGSKARAEKVATEVGEQLYKSCIPLAVSPFSKQLRFPYQDDLGCTQYLAMTPVVSHCLMSCIQRAAIGRKIHFSHVQHAHSASVGDLAASRGGRLAILHYPPPVFNSEKANFHYARVKRLAAGYSLFDKGALYNKTTFHALAVITTYHRELPRRFRRQARLRALRVLRKQLARWLAPVFEWRDEVEKVGDKNIGAIGPCLEKRLLIIPQKNLPELSTQLAGAIHDTLQASTYGQHYAYHPDLLLPLKSQLQWLLKKLADEEIVESSETVNTYFLHVSKLRVYDALALSNPYVCGVPSLTALGGLSHHFERRLNQLFGCEISIKGTAWFIRHYNLNSGQLLPEPCKPAQLRTVSNVVRSGIVDTKTCDLVMDLVFKLEVGGGFKADDISQFVAAFPSRFAGGTLLPPALYERSEWCRLYAEPEEIFSQVIRLPRNGCWIYPHAADFHTLDELLEKVQQEVDLRPVNIGYVGLEEVAERESSLEPLHCYAEPAIGLAQCFNPISVRLDGRERFFHNAFWRMKRENRAMLMTKSTA